MIPKRIKHKGICEHPQTPYARRKCRKALIAAATRTEEAPMTIGSIQTVQIEHRTRDWRGRERITTEEYVQITGTVTAVGAGDSQPMAGGTPVYTVDAGGTVVTVANPRGLADDLHPVAVGDMVRVLATDECLIAGYAATSVERI